MRISVSGSFSVGKTTLIEELRARAEAERLDLHVIPEVARTVLAEGYALDREATAGSYLRYIQLQLERERVASYHVHVLSDRTLIDLLAYFRVNDDLGLPPEIDPLMVELIWRELELFDLYCLLPVEFAPVADGVREMDPQYQRAVDEELRRLLDHFGAMVVEVTGSVHQRADALWAVAFGG